jgi:hypothetical protein
LLHQQGHFADYIRCRGGDTGQVPGFVTFYIVQQVFQLYNIAVVYPRRTGSVFRLQLR